MKKNRLICMLSIFLIPIQGFSQEHTATRHKGSNEIHFYISPQYYFNQINVENDPDAPQLIAAKNTAGINLGLNFTHITHYGLIYGGGIDFGQLGHNITVINYQNFNYFSPAGSRNIPRYYPDSTYNRTISYFSAKALIGYQWKLPESFMKGWSAQVSLGLSFRFYLNGFVSHKEQTVDFYYEGKYIPAIYYHEGLGYGRQPGEFWQYSNNWDWYLGLSRNVDWGWIRSLNVGVKATYAFRSLGSSGGAYISSSVVNPQGKELIKDIDQYNSHDLSIGLKLDLGLWPQ